MSNLETKGIATKGIANMRGILYSICIGSLALALTAQGQEVQGNADVNAKAKARRTSNVHATTSTNTHSAMSTTRSRGNMPSTRTHQSANVSAQTSSSAAVNRNRMRNTSANVNDRTRFTNVTRITSNGRTFNRAVFRDRNDWHFHLGFHDRIFFINRFSEVTVINGCPFFLDEGIFWPAFIVGAGCVPAPNVVFVAVG
jgi:hypothetical protein